MTAPVEELSASRYAALLQSAASPPAAAARKLFRLYGVPVDPEAQAKMALLLYRSMRVARGRTYRIGSQYLAGKGWDSPIPRAHKYDVDAVTTMLSNVPERTFVAGKPVEAAQRSDPLAVANATKVVVRDVEKHVQAPARDVVQDAADSVSGIGWARVLTGPTSCAFCAMLASRGPIYTTEKGALYRGGSSAKTYHPGCDCIADLVTDFDTWEHRESYEKLEDLWADTGGQESNNAARNAFRRSWDKKVRDGESVGFLTPSLQPPGGA